MFPDILGRPMDFAFPSSELAKAFQEGKGFDGSSVEGFVRIEESDLVIKPDPTTFRILPWEYRGFDDQVRWREGILFGDILTPDGKPYEGDARGRLKTALREGQSEFGIDDFKTGPELEFFLFPSDREAVPTDEGGYFFSGRYGEIRKEIQLLLKKMGIESEYDHHEVAHGQHEIDLKFNERPGDRGHRHALPLYGQARGPDARALRHLHAQAHQRAERKRDARPPVPLEKREEHFLRSEEPDPPLRDRPFATWPD